MKKLTSLLATAGVALLLFGCLDVTEENEYREFVSENMSNLSTTMAEIAEIEGHDNSIEELQKLYTNVDEIAQKIIDYKDVPESHKESNDYLTKGMKEYKIVSEMFINALTADNELDHEKMMEHNSNAIEYINLSTEATP